MAEKYQNKYRITSARLKNWDYASCAAYFITICTANREHFLGQIIGGKMNLSVLGSVVEQEWIKTIEIRPDMNLSLGDYVVMPNHVHVLLGLLGENMLPDVLNSWKSYSAHEINKMLGTSGAVWHKESFDRMIRDEDHYQRVLNYIKNNPAKCLANSYSLCVMHESPFVDVTAPSVCDNKGYKVGESVVPEDDEMVATIISTAQAILDARQLYPDSSLADLYDETTMPPELRKAHQENDRAVMRAYGFPKGMTETECVAELMRMYSELTRESGR